MSGALTPEEEFLVAKLTAILAGFEDAPPADVLRAALVRLRTERPEEVAAALPELRAELVSLLEQELMTLRGRAGDHLEGGPQNGQR